MGSPRPASSKVDPLKALGNAAGLNSDRYMYHVYRRHLGQGATVTVTSLGRASHGYSCTSDLVIMDIQIDPKAR